MATCPAGHDSAATDYCDVCGALMIGDGPAAAAPTATAAQLCAVCGAPRDGRFCEVCGHDGAKPVDPTQTVPVAGTGEWSALVRADRSWFEEVRKRNGPDAAILEFPRYCPERRFVLSGARLAIGRRSRSRGIEPEIDLSVPPVDPGVSARHALLVARPDGGWDLVDLDSTNGTTLGDSTDPVAPNIAVALAHGDRIHLGAWTTITITFSAAPGAAAPGAQSR
jgi:hypothetical protein